jgi:uncharacterized protein (DUF4213/DUF364 family)
MSEETVIARLHAALRQKAEQTAVTQLVLGLGYTAVLLEDGAAGLAYTWSDDSTSCCHMHGWGDAEGGPASALLDLLLADGGLQRTVGLAAANALNHAAAIRLPEDEEPAGSLIRQLGIARGTRVSMVGFFPPVVQVLREVGAELDVVDEGKGMGDQGAFRERLGTWADVLIMTSTALLGGAADALLAQTGASTRVALLGPSTPLVPEVFEGTRVELLGGMVPRAVDDVLRTVRHGGGTRRFSRYCRKVYCVTRQASGGPT